MFGLMRPAKCGSPTQKGTDYRLYYCGTCKTMGKEFGQHTRLMLNFDAVFLGELLDSFRETKQEWSKSFKSYNCFNLPKKSEIPVALRYSAAVNVMLGYLKADDHAKDEKGFKQFAWRGVKGGLSRPAANSLEEFSLDYPNIKQWIGQQGQREESFLHLSSEKAKLEWFAEPTAQITAEVFSQGSEAISQPEIKEQLWDLGFKFGQLTYWLDAYQDHKQDVETGQFNAFLAANHGAFNKEDIQQQLLSAQSEVTKSLRALPLADAKKAEFAHRLSYNLNKKLGIGISCKTEQSCASKLSFKEKWQMARNWTVGAIGNAKEQASALPKWANQVKTGSERLILATFMMAVPDKQFQDLVNNTNIVEESSSLLDYAPVFLAATAGILSLMPFASKFGRKKDDDEDQSCWESCCSDCIESCCQACCDSCCESLCGGSEATDA